MPVIERSIKDTKLPTIIISKSDLEDKYPLIGHGNEGSIFNYNDMYALKRFDLFRAMEYFFGDQLTRKFEKIEKMAELKDESFCFPIGLLGFTDLFKEGCYMELVRFDPEKRDFNYLMTLKDIRMVVEYLVKADEAMKRVHALDVVIGDIKENNILIDINGKPVFIDTDNYAYQDYGFDLIPHRSEHLEIIYHKSFSLSDNDIFIFCLMALKLITHNEKFSHNIRNDEELQRLINSLEYPLEIKEELREILSDSVNKPYTGPVLRKISKYTTK